MKTFQGFIIWGNGTKYIEDILKIIRNNTNISIRKIFKKQNINLQKTIQHIYALDEYSKEHIASKTNYLLTCPNEFYIIIVFNKDTIYKEKPNGHKYLYHETMIKWKVRLLYNPRIKNVNIDGKLTNENIENAAIQKFWIPEITQNHVIHSTDSEKELEHIIKLVNINLKDSKDYLLNRVNLDLPINQININNILANTCEKDEIPIQETPHFKYLLGQKEQYKNYILKYLGTVIKDDHLPDKYDELINNFEYGKIFDNKPSFAIVKKTKKSNKYVLLDGVHRVAILKKMGVDSVNFYVDNS